MSIIHCTISTMLVNPKTGRKIKAGGPTHKKLIMNGEIGTVTDIDKQCSKAHDIYMHPDLYRLVLSFTTFDVSLVNNLKQVNKKTYGILKSLVTDQHLVRVVYETMRGKLSKKCNLFNRLIYNGSFDQKFMKHLYILYPVDMMKGLILGDFSLHAFSQHRCQKFSEVTGLLERHEILRYFYKYILSLSSIPKDLVDREIRDWPNVKNLYYFYRSEPKKRRLYTKDKVLINLIPPDAILLPSIVCNNVFFAIQCNIIVKTPQDLSFLNDSLL